MLHHFNTFKKAPQGEPINYLINGHSNELWGLAMHPNRPEFLTCSDDKTIRAWDMEEKKLCEMEDGTPKVQQLPQMAKSVDISPDGSLVAIGMGTHQLDKTTKHEVEGHFAVFDYETFDVIHERPTKEISLVVKFSPDGNLVALSVGMVVEILDTATWNKKCVLKDHHSNVVHLAFSEDGSYLMTNSQDYEILYWNLETGKRERRGSELRDIKWPDWTCVLGWPVQGVWPEGSDGTDVNALHCSHSQDLLVTGDDFGQVKLFNYPCTVHHAKNKHYLGHSSHVTNVRFSYDDSHVISLGGNDTGVFQWIVHRE